jgi:tRNA pseudouridine32 synthase/23S rRNA pseudouridine746 synthase
VGGVKPGPASTRIVVEHRVRPGDPLRASELLVGLSGLSRTAVKDAMVKGAVWLRRPGSAGGERRLRRASAELRPGDTVAIYYDPEILRREPPTATCVEDRGAYSVWNKPAGLLAQGTRFGDHASLLRQAEKAFGRPRPVFLVHRLDREASGLMVIAHTPAAARELSRALSAADTEKRYRAEVRGDLAATHGQEGRIDLPLDEKPATTAYRVVAYDPTTDASRLEAWIRTGRLHQIRRHLAATGHPVLGDPRYGLGNADPRGLQLVAVRLAFRCPLQGRPVAFDVPTDPG